MKVIISGSRCITDYNLVEEAVKLSGFDITEVVSGMAQGVDNLGIEWAHDHGIPIMPFPADWNQHGKWAGFKRNQEMADYGDALIAVWDGTSRGTLDMINRSKLKNLPMAVFQYFPATIKPWPWHPPKA